MVVPAPPRAQFVLVEPDLPFAFLKTRLDGLAHAPDADQRGQSGDGRCVAQGIRHLDGLLVALAPGNHRPFTSVAVLVPHSARPGVLIVGA